MAAANATPVDTATGQIESEQIHLNATTSFKHGSRQTFRRRYSHYIDSNGSDGTYTARPNFIGTNAVGEFSDGSSSIPYQNLGIALTPAQYVELTACATEMKVHSLGYEIKKITVLQENLTTRAQGTTLENTFQSRPSVLMFHDTNHLLDECVGKIGLTTHGSYTGLNDSRPRLNIALQGLPTMAFDTNNDAAIGDFAKTYPGSQTDGGLPEVAWYMRNQAADIAQIPWYLDDLINPIVLGEGEKHSFTWKNPKPEWHKNGFQPYSAVFKSNDATAPAIQSRTGFWASSRAAALKTYYKGGMFDHTADNAYDSTQATELAADRAGLGTKGSVVWNGDGVPPYSYIKMPPLWGPTSKMNFTCEIWVEYHADIEWRTSGLLPYQNHVWPAATVCTNALFSNPMGLSDLRRRFGGAQGNTGVGLAVDDISNVIGEDEVSRKRKRFDDSEE